MRRRIAIMGAAGRDFHNFNVVYRDDPGPRWWRSPRPRSRSSTTAVSRRSWRVHGTPDGIEIYPEELLPALIRDREIDDVVFAYSDVSYEYVMHKASEVVAAGANFLLLGPQRRCSRPPSPWSRSARSERAAARARPRRYIAEMLKEAGLRVVAVRHPMPYGDLAAQRVQRFATLQDLDRADVTVEEREEYESHIRDGTVVYAGVDYGAILEQAQQECDVLLWDGGNNDLPFYRPDVHITVADPLRPGHERTYYPGETNVRMADAVLINKVDVADPRGRRGRRGVGARAQPDGHDPEGEQRPRTRPARPGQGQAGPRVEDGPTLTHGGMKFGAGTVAAQRAGAAAIVDPRPYVTGTIAEVFAKYDVGPVLPAQGYSPEQSRELEEAIERTPCDTVVIGTPMDLRHVIEHEQAGGPGDLPARRDRRTDADRRAE